MALARKKRIPTGTHKAWNNTLELINTDKSMETQFSRLSDAIKMARESRKLTVQQLANLSRLETLAIENIKGGNTHIPVTNILCLFEILKIKFVIQAL
ncbi:MAG: hypothetical protein ACXWTY_13185 [Methylobacter sp.]